MRNSKYYTPLYREKKNNSLHVYRENMKGLDPHTGKKKTKEKYQICKIFKKKKKSMKGLILYKGD